MVRAAATPLQRNVIANRDINPKARIHLTDALVLSKDKHNCGAWPQLTTAEYRHHHSATMSVHRTLLAKERVNKKMKAQQMPQCLRSWG